MEPQHTSDDFAKDWTARQTRIYFDLISIEFLKEYGVRQKECFTYGGHFFNANYHACVQRFVTNNPTGGDFFVWLQDNVKSLQEIPYEIAKGIETAAERDRLKIEIESLKTMLDQRIRIHKIDMGKLKEAESINTELLEALKAVYADIDLDKHGSSELNVLVQSAIKRATL